MDSKILSLNPTLSFFSVVAIFTEKLPQKNAKSVIETSKLCVNKNTLAYTLERPIQNNNHPLQKGQKRPKNAAKKL